MVFIRSLFCVIYFIRIYSIPFDEIFTPTDTTTISTDTTTTTDSTSTSVSKSSYT